MKLGIGTVQFGLTYGIFNQCGQTSLAEVKNILNTAQQYGIKLLDTASLYGNSEEILGRSLTPNYDFKIVTKTPYFNVSKITKRETLQLVSTFKKSLEKLNQNKVYGVLFHNADDVFSANGYLLVNELCRLKSKNLIQKIGFSVYSVRQIDQLLKAFEFDLIQVPINIFDQRLLLSGHLKQLKRSHIEIHARSIFLQGLILMPSVRVPLFSRPIVDLLEKYKKMLNQRGITSIDAALNFVKNVEYIDYILIGVNNEKQHL